MRFLWRRPGRLRGGLAAGFRAQGCLGLPRLRVAAPSIEEVQLRRLNWQGKVIYDVGANVGVFSLFFARESGDKGEVIAFEPVASNYRVLCENLRLNGIANVRAIPLALGARAETRPVYRTAGESGTASVMFSSALDSRYRQGEEVRVEPLDQAVREHDLPAPHFIKIDVEGAEAEVLAGAERLLAATRPDLWIELHGTGVIQKADNARLVAQALFALGYQIFHVETATEVPHRGAPPGTGHIFCRQPSAGAAARAAGV